MQILNFLILSLFLSAGFPVVSLGATSSVAATRFFCGPKSLTANEARTYFSRGESLVFLGESEVRGFQQNCHILTGCLEKVEAPVLFSHAPRHQGFVPELLAINNDKVRFYLEANRKTVNVVLQMAGRLTDGAWFTHREMSGKTDALSLGETVKFTKISETLRIETRHRGVMSAHAVMQLGEMSERSFSYDELKFEGTIAAGCVDLKAVHQSPVDSNGRYTISTAEIVSAL